MVEQLPLISALLIGLLGSTHCLGMCGGISSAISLSIPVGKGFRFRQTTILLSYNIGRIVSYTIAGALVGFLFQITTIHQSALSWVPRLITGLFMIMMGLYLTGWWQGLLKVEKLGNWLWKYLEPIGKKLLPVKSVKGGILLGLVWGWLPCGLVYSTLTLAAAQNTPLNSSLVMLFFGLGTLPSVMAIGYLSTQLNNLKKNPLFPTISGLLVILFGVWTLPIPWGTLIQRLPTHF